MGENGLIALNFWRNSVYFYYNSVKIKILQNLGKNMVLTFAKCIEMFGSKYLIKKAIAEGRYKLVYVAPERLDTDYFRYIIERQEIDKLIEERDRLLADLSSLNIKMITIGKELEDAQKLIQNRFPTTTETEENIQ